MFYDSPGLGYVTATHQQLRRHVGATVFTYYRALHDVMPAEGRRLLLETPRQAWAEGILAELERVHPDIRQRVTRLDVFRNGHAMRRPVPGGLFDGQRERWPPSAARASRWRMPICRVSRCSRKRSIAACWRRSAAWGSADAPQSAALEAVWRQADAEGGADTDFTAHVDAPAVLLDDVVGQRQAEAGAPANRFGGVEGFEDALQDSRRHAAPGVADLDPGGRGVAAGAHGDGAALLDGMRGIDQQVHHHLVDLCGDSKAPWAVRRIRAPPRPCICSSFQTTFSVLSMPALRSASCHSDLSA